MPGLIPAHAGKTREWSRRLGHLGAHPRSRGENMMQVKGDNGITGSSPLTRGKPGCGVSVRFGPGLIPAHAGKTNGTHAPTAQHRAHPRSRGENGFADSRERGFEGSSPLTRGKLGSWRSHCKRIGLIPAHAGKTVFSEGGEGRDGAHPRSRGENRDRVGDPHRAGGSSPLTRGKPVIGRAWLMSSGLIPAHAGKTRRSGGRPGRDRAHPRSRGENSVPAAGRRHSSGSSPLTRGKRTGSDPLGLHPGLIPAHAGKTLPRTFAAPTLRAHPRSRGENVPWWGSFQLVRGSSPLTRGKHCFGCCGRGGGRLIPAHAGKTTDAALILACSKAHPRSRGENGGIGRLVLGHEGSSPLTRGKPGARGARRSPVGLIPAHAGKTPWGGGRGWPGGAHPRSRGENRDGPSPGLVGWGSSPLTRGKRPGHQGRRR